MKYHYLKVWIEDHIVYVILNDAERQNQFNSQLSQELKSIAREIIEMNDIKVIVLGSSGSDFSIGLEAPFETVVPENESYGTVTLASAAIEEWSRLPYPIIAALDGQCSSLGLSLACVADIRYASDNAFFSVPEVTWGCVPAGGITQRLPRLIGKGPAMSMLLGGERIEASQALTLGLVNKVISSASLWEETCNEAKRLAKLSTLSMQFTKECLLRGSELPLEQALRLELDIYMLLQTSHDRMEGVQAFLEKRPLQFKGE
ncbi:enoyl-CoA hydratase/isomerase family protein [Peribacillus sp. NPDC097295]|uniref:enoyl-CoA hydratase/isomerase family protein n=1 Tax=Peribacillus sp. NPDC097295 TaxID=3364402 RepID=UPI00381CE93F